MRHARAGACARVICARANVLQTVLYLILAWEYLELIRRLTAHELLATAFLCLLDEERLKPIENFRTVITIHLLVDDHDTHGQREITHGDDEGLGVGREILTINFGWININ